MLGFAFIVNRFIKEQLPRTSVLDCGNLDVCQPSPNLLNPWIVTALLQSHSANVYLPGSVI